MFENLFEPKLKFFNQKKISFSEGEKDYLSILNGKTNQK